MKKITQAVVLAGGAGTRLKPFTNKNPKPMILIKGRPFLAHLIELLKENGIREVIILTGYLGEKIKDYFGNGSKIGIDIKYSFTPFLNEKKQENESGLRLKNAKKLLDNYFLLLYCDNYWPLNLKRHIQYFKSHPSDVLVTAYSNLDNSTKNNIHVDKYGYVTKYDKGRKEKALNGVDIGFFIVSKKVVDMLPNLNSSFESNILPKLINKRRLSGFLTDQKYYSISDSSRVRFVKKILSPKKVIFLDRDGVINKKPPKANYIKNWDEFVFIPDSIKAIRLLNNKGYKIFIISNQAGIARGIMSEKDLISIHRKMQEILKENGAKIDGIYYCPHGWEDGCNCRKPKPGMLLQASNEHLIDLTKTTFIGDNIRDKQTADAVGCKSIIVNKKRNLLQVVTSITQ